MSGDASASWSYITSIISTNARYLDYVDFFAHNDMSVHALFSCLRVKLTCLTLGT